jgi:hypothetical protein
VSRSSSLIVTRTGNHEILLCAFSAKHLPTLHDMNLIVTRPPTPHMARHAPAVNVCGQSGFATLAHEHGRSAAVTLWCAGSGCVQKRLCLQCPFVPLPIVSRPLDFAPSRRFVQHDGHFRTLLALWHNAGPVHVLPTRDRLSTLPRYTYHDPFRRDAC